MRHAMIALLIGLGLLLLWNPIPALASNDSSAALSTRAELVAEIATLLDQALYLSIAALSWPDEEDLALYVQGVINLIEGPSSPHYDDSTGATTPDGDGMKTLYETFQAYSGALPSGFSISLAMRSAQAREHTEQYLLLAAEAAEEALAYVESAIDAQEELRAMYAYLLAARGRSDDELTLGGISALAEIHPSLIVRASSTVSLQEVIDRAPPGSIVHLDPGTYHDRILVDKDLTLIGPEIDGAERPVVELEGLIWDFVVSVEGEGVVVRLENISIANGSVGIAVGGENTLYLKNVWIRHAGHGIAAQIGPEVYIDTCSIGKCELGMSIFAGVTARVVHSEIFECAADGVFIKDDGSLTMTESVIRDNAMNGIYLRGDASLHLEETPIHGNGGFGVYALPFFTGTISGGSNTIPGPDEEHANLLGDISPEEYRFLKESGG